MTKNTLKVVNTEKTEDKKEKGLIMMLIDQVGIII